MFQWILVFCLWSQVGHSQTIEENDKKNENTFFSNEMKREGKERSSAVWLPLLSYVAPGTVQYMNGQTGAGLVYSITGGIGLGVAASGIIELNDRLNNNEDLSDLESRDSAVRRYLWGMKTYDLAGSLSLYHAFRTTLISRQKRGDFAFMPTVGETTDELMVAPFNFSNLGRWTTIVPLALGLGLVIYSGANDDYHTRDLTAGDIAFAGGISYNAGVGEEALFRGWMFPLLVEGFGSSFWGNMAQSAIFAAAHISSDNPVPIPQFLAGYYFAWLAKRNNWTLQESIFVHTWWDVIVFTASFTQGDKKASIYVPLYQTQF